MSAKKSKPITYSHAYDLRRDPTPTESRLWSYLRTHQFHDVHFRRQHPIGKYIVDFCAPQEKLIIELDGSQHIDNQALDDNRSVYFTRRGYTILRFWNNEIYNNIDGVIVVIENALFRNSKKLPPPTSPI